MLALGFFLYLSACLFDVSVCLAVWFTDAQACRSPQSTEKDRGFSGNGVRAMSFHVVLKMNSGPLPEQWPLLTLKHLSSPALTKISSSFNSPKDHQTDFN